MEKVLSIRSQLLGCVMAILLMSGIAGAQAPQQLADPESGKVAVGASTMESSKLAKLTRNLDQAAIAFREANFEAAAGFYEAALKLDPTLAPAREKLALSRSLVQAQAAARKAVPAGGRAKERFLDASFKTASDDLAKKNYAKAAQEFNALWLTAGDYQGKTVKSYAEAVRLSAAPAAAVPAKAVALNGDAPLPSVPPVAATTVQAQPESASPTDPALQLKVGRLVHQAQAALDENKLDDAARYVKQARDIAPDNDQVRQLAAQLKARGFNESQRILDLLTLADKMADEKKWAEASAYYEEVQKIDAKNRQAIVGLERAQRELGYQSKADQLHGKQELAARINALLKEAQIAYRNKDLAKARECWTKTLELDAANKDAKTWIEMTEEAWGAYQKGVSDQVRQKEMAAKSEKLLSAPIRIATEREIPLSDFMYLLSNTTPVELEYYIAQGADVPVMANFVDKSLQSILDTILPPKGLTWTIDNNNVITIEQKIETRTFKLSPIQLNQVRALLDSGVLQQTVWGQATAPSAQVEMKVDDRTNLLIVSGSGMHIQRVESFLKGIPENVTSTLDTRFYKIRPEDAQKIQALISTLIQTDQSNPLTLERKVFAQGDDLFIRDTPENLTKIEELLLDRKFIQKLTNEELQIANYSLVPRDVDQIQADYITDMTGRIIEAIETFLYAQEGAQKASSEGRRLWFDESTLQLTIVDYPTNLDQVRKYIDSLPELRKGAQQDVVYLQYAEADTLAPSLERILNLTSGIGGSGGSGQQTRFTLRRGESKEFQGATIRLQRVEQNDVQDRNDDTAQVTINVPGMGPQQGTVQEFETQTIGDYEVTAENVLPSSGINGDGQATLSVRYIPQVVQQQIQMARQMGMANGLQQLQQTTTPEQQGITINAFADLNAIIIRYENPELHAEALSLIKQLDKAMKQVEIETKFVQVNESRAKELSSDFTLNGLGSGRSVDWDTQLINTRFAQDQDEYGSAYEPMMESLGASNLLKGTTAISMVFGSYPNVQWNLRLLEAEGIVNIVNGPRVTALHGVQAEFRIESYNPQNITSAATNETVDFSNPLLEAVNNNVQLSLPDTQGGTTNGISSAVVLQVTPSITSDKNIILRQLTTELIDPDQNIAQLATEALQGTATDATGIGQYFNPVVGGQAAVNQGVMSTKRKKILTDARISNGGTIVLGGWTGETSSEYTSGVPLLRNMPFIGKLLFSRNQRSRNKTTLLIFLTGWIVETE